MKLTFDTLEKARQILKQEGHFQLYPDLTFECGCGIFDDKVNTCKFHHEQLVRDCGFDRKPDEDVTITEVFGIKLVR